MSRAPQRGRASQSGRLVLLLAMLASQACGALSTSGMAYETRGQRERRELGEETAQLVDAGDAALAAGDLATARLRYREAADGDASAAAPRLGLATVAMREHRYGEAERWLREVITLVPDEAGPRYLLINSLLHQRRVEDARKEFQLAQGTSRGDERTELRLKATIALRSGQTVQAARLFDEYIDSWPDDAAGWVGLGVALAQAGEIDEALAKLHKAERIAPDSAVVHYDLALVYYRASHLDEAIHHGERAVALDPLFLPARINLASALVVAGQPEKAELQLRATLQVRDSYAPAQNNLGVVLLARGDLAGAVAAFAKAVHHAPRSAAFQFNLGIAHFRLGQLREARTAFETVVALSPGDRSARANLTWLDGYEQGTIKGTKLPAMTSKYAVDDYDE